MTPATGSTGAAQATGSTSDWRYARLDALRALAAVMVMAHHFVISESWDMAPASAFFFNGYRGVLVFFVLSGFLVFRPFASGQVQTGRYLLRRVARIMPAYVVALVGVTLLSGEHTFVDHPAQFLLLLQNYDPALFQRFIPPSWTLGLEMTFYLALPVFAMVFLWFAGGRLSRGLCVLALIAAAAMVAHLALSDPTGTMSPGGGTQSLPAMLWAFVPGMAVALVLSRRPDLRDRLASRSVASAGAALVALGWTAGGGLVYAIADASLVIGIALMIPWLIRLRTSPEHAAILRLAWFGVVVSYPFYLWHMAVMHAVVDAGVVGPLAFGVTFGLVVLIGILSYRLVELPAMRWSQSPSVPCWIRKLRPRAPRYLVQDGDLPTP